MKFKTRLLFTSVFIVVAPLLLTAVAFMGIGIYMANSEQEFNVSGKNYTSFAYTLENYDQMTEEILIDVKEQLHQNSSTVENIDYLESLNEELAGKSSYIIVRKDDDIFYAGNAGAAEKIFTKLPEYGSDMPDAERGYYYHDMRKLVKQLDFTFFDGAEGSFFIVTRVSSLISQKMLIDMILAFILILIFTSMFLTQWMQKGVFTPVSQLNTAMQNIAEGNLEYRLSSDGKGEIGELYRNYEDMRLRLKESLDEKFEHEKQNRELISNISHDLKTPITAVKGYVEGIMDGVADTPEKMDKYIKTIYNKANDMDKLINELTIYSGIDNSRIPYNFHRINVAEYFGDCVEEVGLDLDSKNIQLNYEDLVSPDTQIIADPEQLKRVINNIIGNSVKYLDKANGIIDIRILDEVDSIRVEIEDNGKGIAAKDLPNIFERFYRTDASRNSAQGGSGIGLSIVKKIIEDHGGYIWATSKEMEGTCMHFVIRKYIAPEQEEVNAS
ncbi:MAG: HAMP domain-containing histidine kinase [Bacillus sp. (in: Bacteria)]|nr:HAMP domain-containing histidine kinase [Bacillus sp. (in: firmicutes)]MCM1425401.1 HAMP domain-containing histidine kinase [Eubacterium sp.]